MVSGGGVEVGTGVGVAVGDALVGVGVGDRWLADTEWGRLRVSRTKAAATTAASRVFITNLLYAVHPSTVVLSEGWNDLNGGQ
jgi:hypothetical protein